MAILCDFAYFYHDRGPGASGNDLLNQTLYVSGNGGAVMDGYYSDGTFIYTVSGGMGVVTLVETASSLGCAGTTPDPSPSPIPQGNSLLLGFRSNQINACIISSEPSQRFEMWSNADEISLQNVASSIIPSDSLLELNYYMYADVYMTTPKPNGYYSDGTYWYRVTDNLGRITDAGSC